MVKNRNIIITEVLIMKKASDIVLLVGSILGFVAAGGLFIASIVMVFLSTPLFTNFVRESVENGTATTDFPSADEAVVFMTALFISLAVTFILVGVLSIIASAQALKARRENRKGLYIACLVLGILANEVILVGSIFGLIAYRPEEPVQKKEPDETIDMTK